MKIDKEYRFPVSISKENFIDKNIVLAVIGKSTDQNIKTRLQYGFKEDSTVHFYKKILTSEDVISYLTEGHCVCNIFNGKHDEYIEKWEKSNKNFKEAYIIGVDIDETRFQTMRDYIEALSLKPTIFYTSYRDHTANFGAKFRMFYVFDKCIAHDPYEFRYVAQKLYDIIERDINVGIDPDDKRYEKIEDKCGLSCTQYMNGTNKNNKDLKVKPDYDKTDCIYNIMDLFNSEEEYHNGLIEYLVKGCGYSSLDTEKKKGIQQALYRLTKERYVYIAKDKAFLNVSEDISTKETIITPDVEKKCNRSLITCLKAHGFKGYEKVREKYRHQYPYIYRKEKPVWIDNEYQFVDDDYFSLFFYIIKVKDGNGRRKKLYNIMNLRRILYPKADANILLYDAFIDVGRYFEDDPVDLTIDCLVKNVENVMEHTIEEIYYNFKDMIEELKITRKPKSNFILRRGIARTTEEYNKKYKEVRWRIAAQNYNTNLSFRENHEIINDITPLGTKTLRDVCKFYNIKISEKITITDEEALEFIDVNMSERQLLQMFKDNNISIGRERIRKLKKQKESGLLGKIPTEDWTSVENAYGESGLERKMPIEDDLGWTSVENRDILCTDCVCEDPDNYKKENQKEDKMNKDSFEYDWDWIEDVGNFIENDPFMQSHRGREYAISIGLIKEIPDDKPEVDVEFNTDDFTEKIQRIKTNSLI